MKIALGISLLITFAVVKCDDNPYKPMKLFNTTQYKFSVMDSNVVDTLAIYPVTDKKMPIAPIVFISGWDAVIPATFYTDILTGVASRGFAVFAIEFPLLHIINPLWEAFDSQIQVLKNTAASKLNLNITWTNGSAIWCHSAGCDPVYNILLNRGNIFKTALFMEPYTFSTPHGFNFSMPAGLLATELSEGHGHGCSQSGYDYNTFYDMWRCPEVLLAKAADVGHCGVLNEGDWKLCNALHMCTTTTDESVLPAYHRFVVGYSSAFFRHYLLGINSKQYLTNQANIPYQLLDLKSKHC